MDIIEERWFGFINQKMTLLILYIASLKLQVLKHFNQLHTSMIIEFSKQFPYLRSPQRG